MAYPAYTRTFVSGGTIYSTAVSGNFVSVMNGYTTGNYAAWVNTFVASGACRLGATGAVEVTSTGTMTVGGDVSVAGDMTIGGDCYTTAYTSFAPAPTNLGASLCSGMYRTLGGWCHVDLYMHGVASANANVTITLPRTAASNIMANNGYMGQMLKDGAMAGPGHMVIVPDTLGAIVYPDAYVTTSFVSSSSYSMWFSVDYPVR